MSSSSVDTFKLGLKPSKFFLRATLLRIGCAVAVAEWKDAFVNELRGFPHGHHDDQVDAFVHALRYLNRLNRLEWSNQRPTASRPQGGRRRPGNHR